MNDVLFDKMKTYENKMNEHMNDDKFYKYKWKYDSLFNVQHGGDVEDDLKLLNQMEIKSSNKMGLLDYQEPHANSIISILEKNITALDASDPGIGKTYMSAYACKFLGLKPFIICPKNVVNAWIKVLKLFDVEYLGVVNYELIGRGKYYVGNAKINCPYIDVTKNKNKSAFKWNMPSNSMFIFDEAHRCKFIDTLNAKLLLSAKETNNKILLLSATIVEKPLEFAIFGYVLGFSQSLKIMTDWIKKLTTPAKTIHTLLYDKDNPKAARLSISELGDKFPNTQITADTYTMKGSNEISKVYEKIAEKIKAFKKEGEQSKFMIAKLQTEFRNIELLKIPTFVEMANDYIENNYSVVIFVNYTETLNLLSEQLKTKTLIYGDQNAKERDKNIDDFQTDKSRIIIANIRAGGIGISLHDINGKHPRVSLISPTQSATNLIQALGRIHRSGGKTKSLQRIIFAANTPEDGISKMLFRKLTNLSLLNDGDMESYYIDGLIEDNEFVMNQKLSNKDMAIEIDAQLEKFKSKNFAKMNSMSEIFLNNINTISGANCVYLLKGNRMFEGKELLLLGEIHTILKPCGKCDRNCLEVIDVVSFVMYSLHPRKVDLYIETEYNPIANKKNRMETGIGNADSESRIEQLYRAYRHLLNSKVPITENLRLHAVDVRPRLKSTDYGNLIFDSFAMLAEFVYDWLGYVFHNIFYNMLKPWDNTVLLFNANAEQFEHYANNLKIITSHLEHRETFDMMEKILQGNNDIFDALKITKQKDKYIENGGDEYHEFNRALENNIHEMFIKHASKSITFLKYVRDVLIDVKNVKDTFTYMEYIVNKLIKDKYSYTKLYDDEIYKLQEILATYLDMYAIYRMLRQFDGKTQNHVVFYGGSMHTTNLCKIFKSTGYFDVVIKKEPNYNVPNDCQKF